MPNDPAPAPAAIPLPQFRQPRPPDPALATVPVDEQSPGNSPTTVPPAAATSARDDQPEPLPPIAAPPAAGHTRTSATDRPKADPNDAAKVLGGLLLIGLASLGAWLARNGRDLRMPTPRQRDDISAPLGSIVARYLPAELVNGTLVDITEAASATHAYVLDEAGPLITSRTSVFAQE